MRPFLAQPVRCRLLGQHSTEVLKDFDYSDDDIAQLITDGAVIQAPGA